MTRLSAGQHLKIGGAVATSAVAAAATDAPRPSPGCVGPQCKSSARGPARSRLDATWRELADRGEHAAAVRAAERHGLGALVARLDAKDLDQLAHSARLVRAAGPAREALHALRRRFPAHARAQGTAFLLARVALDIERDAAAAAAWFDTYLREQPEGALAEEARGRLVEIWRSGGEEARVQAAAREYLQHHAEGSSAGLARRILDRR